MTADTRRDRTRLRRGRARQRHIALLLLFALEASGMGAWLANPAPATADTTVRASIGVKGRPDPFPAADRDRTRTDLTVDGTWDMGDRPEGRLTIIHADNPVVRDLINGRDEDQTPAGFDPDHATGDTGNAYAYGQCTWWAYVRRTQLGLPVGSHLGDGGMWADSAKALGYWVDDTPRQGDVIVFSPAQVSNAWGHVAIVEKVNGDGSIEISEANVNGQVGPFRRAIEAKQTHEYQYIHY